MNNNLLQLIVKAEKSHSLDKKEISNLLNIKDNSPEKIELFSAANRVRKKYVGDEVHLRGLIEFSNFCKKNCYYCGLRKENKSLERYRILPEEIIEIASKAVKLGYRSFVLQSGEDLFYTKEKICNIIAGIKKLDVAITLCVGEREFSDYDAFIEAGLDRYLLRIETTNTDLFKKLHPDDDYDFRLSILKYLKQKNVQIGTGVMIGLPGQTIDMLAGDILFYKNLDIDMIGEGPFIANPNTPLADSINGEVFLTLKVLLAKYIQ